MQPARAGSLLSYLAQVPDPRGRKGRRHPLSAMLTAVVCGFLCGHRGWTGLAEWLNDQPLDVCHWMFGPFKKEWTWIWMQSITRSLANFSVNNFFSGALRAPEIHPQFLLFFSRALRARSKTLKNPRAKRAVKKSNLPCLAAARVCRQGLPRGRGPLSR